MVNNFCSDPKFLIEARENATEWLKEVDARAKRLGSAAHWDNMYKQQQLLFRTCDLCGEVCKDQMTFEYRHRKSRECLKRQAENDGKVYVPTSKERVKCECGKEVFRCNLALHKDSDGHKRKMQPFTFSCQFCNKDFLGKRPKRDYLKHCSGTRHLKKVAEKNFCPVIKTV